MKYNNENTEVLNLRSLKPKKKKDKKIFFLRVLPLMMIPILFVLTIISTHSTRLVIIPINYIIYILLSLFIYLLIISFFLIKKKKKKLNKKEKIKKIFSTTILIIYVLGCFSGLFLLYGPYDKFRVWFISTSMSTMSHQYFCQWFYSDEEINKVINGNYTIEVNEETNTDLINMEEEETYDNEYEKQILKRDKNADYKIIELEVNGQKAYLAAIYDPSKVKVAVSNGVGTYGQYATKIAENNNAILATNGGGFGNAPGNQTGGRPTGVTISNGKVITDNTYSSDAQSGGLIGMTDDNKLVLIKQATAAKAKSMNVRDGVSWGPFLIVNGKKSFMKGNGGWGYAARTAIGQRSDGIILLLVVNSNSTRTKGADMVNLTEIMSNYGAVNAANLDGGTSSVMILPKKEALKYRSDCTDNYCYINDPVDSSLRHKTRGIPTTIIVTK